MGFGGDVGSWAGVASTRRSVFGMARIRTRSVLPLDVGKRTRVVDGRTVVPLEVHVAVRLALGHPGGGAMMSGN